MDRKTTITHELNLPFYSYILKYDFYLQGEVDMTLEGMVPLNCIIQLPDGRIVGGGGDIKIWDFKSCKVIPVGRRKKIHALGYYRHMDNKIRILSHSHLGPIKMWDLESLTCVSTFYFSKECGITCFKMIDNTHIAVGFDDGSLHIYNLLINILVYELEKECYCIGFIQSLSHNRLISSSRHTLTIFNYTQCISFFHIRIEDTNNLFCELPNDRIAYKHNFNSIRIGNIITGEMEKELKSKLNISSLVYAGGKLIGCEFKSLGVWDIETGECEIKHYDCVIQSIYVLFNGEYILKFKDYLLLGDKVIPHKGYTNAMLLLHDNRLAIESKDKLIILK